MQHFFSIIIVTWNGLHHLKTFLPSVCDTVYDSFEIILADNASTDGTVQWIRTHYPQCKVVTFDQNYGYCGGNNRAVPYAEGDVLLFLNNDVRVDPLWLQELNSSFQDPETTIVQPKMLSHQRPEEFEYAGAAGGMIDWLGYPFCRGRIFEHVEPDEGQYDNETSIFWASGAALAIRKQDFIDLNGFDEDFEFHMEEIDLCWRAWNEGCKVRYQPKSKVYHLGGGSMPMGSARKIYYNYRNSLLMLTKNLNSLVFLKLFLRIILDGISGIRSLLMLKPQETFSIIRAHFAYYSLLPSVLSKRSAIQHRAVKDPSTEKAPVHPNLIIVDAYLKGKKTYSDL